MPPRRGRRRIVAERIWTRVENPGATVIEANRSDGWYRSVDGAQEPSMMKSAHRVLRIFEYFAEIQRPASMTEIARRLNYPPSSTSALLKSLLNLGYLDCDRKARTYVPTARISLVGGWVRNRAGGDLETIAQALHEAMRLTTFIASRNQLSQYIRVIQGTTAVRFYLEPGGLRLLPASTPGRAGLQGGLGREAGGRRRALRADPEHSRGAVTRADCGARHHPAPGRRQPGAHDRHAAVVRRRTSGSQTAGAVARPPRWLAELAILKREQR